MSCRLEADDDNSGRTGVGRFAEAPENLQAIHLKFIHLIEFVDEFTKNLSIKNK